VAATPPTQQIPPQQPPYGGPPGGPPPPYGGPPGPQKKSPAPWIALGAVVLAAIIVGVLAIAGVFGGSSDNNKKAASTTPVTTPAQATPTVAMPQSVPETTDTTNESNPADYPPGIEKTFVDSCSSGGAPRSVCQCTFNKLKSRYTFTEFVDLLNQSKGGSLPEPIQSIVKQCVNS
jgi:hypothetical protein